MSLAYIILVLKKMKYSRNFCIYVNSTRFSYIYIYSSAVKYLRTISALMARDSSMIETYNAET